MAFHSTADEIFFGGAGGGGKALALDTPLPTPTGWTAVCKVRVGDTLFDERGQPCTVQAMSPIEHHHQSYRLTFDDGSSIVASADHRWLTLTIADYAAAERRTPEYREKRRATRPSKVSGVKSERFTTSLTERNRARTYALLEPPVGSVKTTQEIYETQTLRGGRTNHAVPVTKALQCPPADLPLDPYLFGTWLGDGHTHNGRISTDDQEILDAWHAAGFETRSYGKYDYGIYKLKVILRDHLGVLHNKHVPPVYLRASSEQRLALLQGLMDTDGYAKPTGGVAFTTTKPELAEAVHELIVSLGWKAAIREGQAKLNGRYISQKYTITFKPDVPVFRLARKACRHTETNRRTQKFRYITNVEPAPAEPMRCLYVDSPSHLFLAGGEMVPTHNTDIAIGLALRKHTRAAVFRRTYGELSFIIDRMREIIPDEAGRFTVTTSRWTLYDKPGHIIELAGIEKEDDVAKWRGRPHDLKVFDEASEFLKDQFTWLTAWARTTNPQQKVTVLLCSNPPRGVEGWWLVERYAPWLDHRHPEYPVPSGDVRWFATLDGVDTLLEDGVPFLHRGEPIKPLSRTFIRSKVQDNPYQPQEYINRLKTLPEPLRSQILDGNFAIGMDDDAFQVIPSSWIRAAIERGRNREMPPFPLSQVGVDVARGGLDYTVFARRAGNWILPLQRREGASTANGYIVAQHALSIVQGNLTTVPICVDATGGFGSGPWDIISRNWELTYGVNATVKVDGTDRTGTHRFLNVRAFLWWTMRELLDPDNTDIPERERLVLPDDPDLALELAAPRFKVRAGGVIQIESKDELRKRLGRSTDSADACLLSLFPADRIPELSMSFLQGNARDTNAMGFDADDRFTRWP